MRNRKGNKNYHDGPVEGVYERPRGQFSIHANIQSTEACRSMSRSSIIWRIHRRK